MTFLWYCILLQHLFCFCQLWLFQALVIIKFNQRNHISACSPSTSTIQAFQNLFSVKPFHNLLGHCSVVRDFFISKNIGFPLKMLIFSLASLTLGFLAGVTFSDRLVRPLSSTNITSSYSSIQILTNINKFWQILTNINKYHYIIFKYTLSKFVLPSFLDVTMFFSLVLTHHIYNPNLNGALFFFRYVPMKCIFLVKDLIISQLPYIYANAQKMYEQRTG